MDISWIASALNNVRAKRPLVHNITNYVVMNTTANALLALGASPIMAHSPEELEDLIKIADAIVINIGTLDEKWIYSMLAATRLAKDLNKPVILDPVGAGATKLRTRTSLLLLESSKISAVRGNYGEISALLGEVGKTKGVDTAMYDKHRAGIIAYEVAQKYNTVVSVTGPVDYVSDGKYIYEVFSGSSALDSVIHHVTGLGCIVTSVIGAYLAVQDPLRATISGLATFRVAASKAAEESPYPGTFHTKIYDWLYRVTGEDIIKSTKVSLFELS
ncbi:MAG: hydroxyethylthiazole kinase [Desulfurococcaceae archaeon]